MKKKPYDPVEAADLFPEEGWGKSTFSDQSGVGCVEINTNAVATHGLIGLRDSTQPGRGTFAFDETEWRAFLDGARAGEFDWPVA